MKETLAQKYSYSFLEDVCRGLLKAQDADAQVENDVTQAVLETSLYGIDTHGIAMLPKILKRCSEDRSQVKKPAELVGNTNDLPVGVVDAHLTPGQHACLYAARLASEKAKRFGIGLIAIRNSTHFGACIPYLLEVLHHRYVAFAGSNSLRSMAAFDLRRANLGNNPFGFATPVKGGKDFIFDSSCSVMSFGQRNVLRAEGKPVPEEAFIKTDEDDGTAGVCEIADTLEELAVPFGGYKGASIAVMIEVLSGLLSSGYVGEKTEIMENKKFLGPSQFVMTINPEKFDTSEFEQKSHDYVNGIRRNQDIRLPGDQAFTTKTDRQKNGIPIAEPLLNDLQEWCENSHLDISWA